jgi:structural maintenance of chromosome 1
VNINVIHFIFVFRSSTQALQEQRDAENEMSLDVGAASGRLDEIDAELSSIQEQLGQAKVDKHESARAVKKAELLENLKRLFPGVVG